MLNTVKVGDYFGKYQRLFISFFVLSDLRSCADKDKRKINSGGKYEETNNEQTVVNQESKTKAKVKQKITYTDISVAHYTYFAALHKFRSPCGANRTRKIKRREENRYKLFSVSYGKIYPSGDNAD